MIESNKWKKYENKTHLKKIKKQIWTFVFVSRRNV